MGEEVVTVLGEEVDTRQRVAADVAGDRGRAREEQRARRGGGERLAIHEAAHRTREGRIDGAIEARSRVGGDGQGRRSDRKRAVDEGIEDVVGGGEAAGCGDNRVRADVTGRGGGSRDRGGAGDTGIREGLAVDEAAHGAGEGRIGRAVEAGAIARGDRQGSLGDRQGAIHEGERVVRGGQARRGERVGSGVDRSLAGAGKGKRAGETAGDVSIAEAGVGDAVAPRIGEAVIGLGGGDRRDRQGSRGHREGGAVRRCLDEEVVSMAGREAGGGERIATDIAGLGGGRRESERARGRIAEGVPVDEAGDRAGEGRVDQAILAGRGVRGDRQRGRRDREDAVDGIGEDVVRGGQGTRRRRERVVADVARGGRGGGHAGAAGDSRASRGLAVHETEQVHAEARVGRTIDAVGIRSLERQGSLADGEGSIDEAERIVARGKTNRGEHIGAGVGRALARSGEGERARKVGGRVGIAEAGVADAIAPRIGEAVVGLGGGGGRDRQGSRGHREGGGVAGGLGEDVVAVVGDEAVAGHVVAADIAGDGGRRGESQRARRGGSEALAVDEAGDRAGEGRIGQAILAGRGVSRDGQRGRGDREAAVGNVGEVVVVRCIAGSARDDRVVADVARRGRDRGRAAGTGDTGGRQGLAVHEAGEGRREGRVGGAIGARRIRGDHRQGGLVHREGGRSIGDRVVRAGEARAGERIAARVDGVLGTAAEDERAAEDGGVLAIDETGEGRALPA